ncbi:MAG: hypothetical protein IJ877_02035 [Candidatus Gastranaerophilales bacterium]|nr:hypothetical protein [Candidatus Gastranaerophilales bacterium]
MDKYFSAFYSGWHVMYRIFGIKMKFQLRPKHIDTVNIVTDPRAGIGNRLFGLINVLSYFTPREINIFWDTKNWVSAKLNEIFDIKTNTIINEFEKIEEVQNIKAKNSILIYGPSCALKTLKNENISLKYNEIPKEAIEYFNNFFQNVKPSKQVSERIKNYDKTYDYALQIRNNKDWQSFNRNENLELFFDKLKAMPDNSKIFLSAMNTEVSKAFKDRFGSKIVELENKNYNSMIDAVSDLYLLSRAKSAVYSFGSTFGELAFWLNGAKQKVEIIGSDENWNG